MPNFYLKWFLIQFKNNFKSVGFYFSIVLMIIATWLFNQIGDKLYEDIKVLLYNEATDETNIVVQELLNESIDGYSFTTATSRAEIESDVLKGKASVGVIFHEGLNQAIASGEFKGQVEIIQPVGSAEGYVLREILFPYIQKAAAYSTLKGYIESKDKDIPKDIEDRILKQNEDFISDSELSIFKVIETDTLSADSVAMLSFEKIFVALLIFIALAMSLHDVIASDSDFYKVRGKAERIVLIVEKVLSQVFVYIIVCIAIMCMIKL